MTNNVQPIYIMPENTNRDSGKSAQRNNILAGKLVAETVRTTLGPKGMDKMLVDGVGEIIVTNDGVTILNEMQIEHPAAKMIVEVARTQENEVGDGTTTAVVLAGEFLKNAEKLLDDKIHPTVIIKGYRLAQNEAFGILDSLSESMSVKDTNVLKKIAQTAMTGKGAEAAKELLSDLAVRGVKAVTDENDNVDIDSIKIEKKVGGSINDSTYIQGIVLDKEKVHPGMPSIVNDAKIVLLDSSLEIKETESDAKVSISDPTQMQAFLDMEEQMIDRMVKNITDLGANVVLCQKGVDDLAAYQLAKRGILVVRRVKKSDIEKLSKATGATIVSNIKDLERSHLGKAGSAEQKKIGEDSMIFIEGCTKARAVTILVRGGTEHVVDEIHRAVTDAVGDLSAAVESGKVVAGAGSVEIELSKQLNKFAKTLSGREQLAVEAFANSLEIIPRTLAENAGLDPIDILADLKTARNQKWAGIDVFSGKVMNAWNAGVIEPLKVKTQAISSATEVAIMILRIDDVIASGPDNSPGPEMPEM